MTTVKSFANRFVYETRSLTVTTLMMTVSGRKKNTSECRYEIVKGVFNHSNQPSNFFQT